MPVYSYNYAYPHRTLAAYGGLARQPAATSPSVAPGSAKAPSPSSGPLGVAETTPQLAGAPAKSSTASAGKGSRGGLAGKDSKDGFSGALGEVGGLSTVGALAGLATGMPGLGVVGAVADGVSDVNALDGRFKSYSPTVADHAAVAVNNMSFGLFGKTAAEAMGDATGDKDSQGESTPQGLADTVESNPSRSRGANQGDGPGAGGQVGGSAGHASAPGAMGDGSRGPGSGGDAGGDKIVCTAMNERYGFGAFRQAIWLEHARGLHPAYQRGYHAIFRPYVRWAYGPNGPRWARAIGEHIARRRTADIWKQRRGKRDPVGMIERAVLEPLCLVVGLIKGK